MALETAIMIEHIRMTKIISNPVVSNSDIQSQIFTDLQLLFDPANPDSPFSYVAWLDPRWTNANAARFPQTATLGASTFKTRNWDYVNDFNNNYRNLFPQTTRVRIGRTYSSVPVCGNRSYLSGYEEQTYFYNLQGIAHTGKIKQWFDTSGADLACAVILDTNGVVFDYEFGPMYTVSSNKLKVRTFNSAWAQNKINSVMARDVGTEYSLFLERGFGPARDILDGWWALTEFSDTRPRLGVDNYLDSL